MRQKTDIFEVKCLRCGYRWIPRTNFMPYVCPRCHSNKWDIKPTKDELGRPRSKRYY